VQNLSHSASLHAGENNAPSNSGINQLTPIVRFARTLNRDIDAVRNAIEMQWSNGQAEGQINRLKTLKRAMYGRAGPNSLRARMLPLHHTN
jgi:transposase